ncbi:hypothetical protein [Thiomonas intermedia]|uniref:hypothetical protein n=1 Tax=Thiomonas intermedia TaxID=926 RepID=UPI0009A531ED|nr:hypothetical protein [Thiomonas intermedia]
MNPLVKIFAPLIAAADQRTIRFLLDTLDGREMDAETICVLRADVLPLIKSRLYMLRAIQQEQARQQDQGEIEETQPQLLLH